MNEVAGIKGLSRVSEDMIKLTQAAKESAKNVPGSVYTESAEALKYLALAGWDTNQSMEALEPTLKAIKINGVDVKETADALTDSMTALGLSAKQSGDFVDYATAVQGASNTNMLQLNEALIKCGAGFQSLYTRMDTAEEKMQIVKDTMGMIGVLSSGGFKAERAGTILNSLFTRMTKETGETARGLESIGLSLYDTEGKLKGPLAIFTEMNEKVKGLTEQERNAALADIGGRYRSQLMQLMSAMNTVGDDGRTAIEKINEAMAESEGAADRYIGAVTDGYSGSLKVLKAEWENFKEEIGEIAAPYATEGIQYITEKLPTIEQWLKDRLPSALEKGKEIIIEIKDALKWIVENYKTIGAVAGGAYMGMGAFRLATGAMEGYDTFKRIQNGLQKQRTAYNHAYGLDNIRGLSLWEPLTNDERYRQDGKQRASVTKALKKGELISGADDIIYRSSEASGIFKDESFFDSLQGHIWGGKASPEDIMVDPSELKAIGTQIAPIGTVSGNTDILGRGAGTALASAAGRETSERIFSDKVQNTSYNIFTNAAGAAAAPAITETVGGALAGTAAGEGAAAAGAAGGATMAGFAATAAAIGAVVVTLVGAFKNSEIFRNSLAKIGEAGKTVFGKIKEYFEQIKPVLLTLQDAFGEVFGFVGDVLGTVIDVLKPVVSLLFDILAPIMDAAWSLFCTLLKTIADVIKGIFSALRTVIGKLREFGAWFYEKCAPIREAINKYLVEPIKSVCGWIKDAFNWWQTLTGAMEEEDQTEYVLPYQYHEVPTQDVDASTGRSEAEGGDGNALGTSYWKGGKTRINEQGGEIIDLPSGSRVIPADKSGKMMQKGNINITVHIENMYGEDERYVERIGNRVAHELAMVM